MSRKAQSCNESLVDCFRAATIITNAGRVSDNTPAGLSAFRQEQRALRLKQFDMFRLMVVACVGLCACGCSSSQKAKETAAPVSLYQLREFLPQGVPGYTLNATAVIPETIGPKLFSVSREFVGPGPAATLRVDIFFDGEDNRSDIKRRDSVAGNDTKLTVGSFPAVNHAAQTTRQLMVFAGHCTVVLSGLINDEALLKSVAENMNLPALAKLGKG